MVENSEQHSQGVLKQHWQQLLVAVMFYTRLPVPPNLPHSEQLLNDSRTYLPAVGFIVGTLSVLGFLIFSSFLPTSTCVALSLVMSILTTGAFHEDGFADSCDGLGGGWSKDQVLTIMKDSRIGTYGSLGLLMLITVKFLTLWEIAKIDSLLFCLIVIFSHTASRLLASTVIDFYDYVQDIDKSKIKPITSKKLSPNQWRTSLGITAFVSFFIIVIQTDLIFRLAIAALSAGFISWLFSEYCKKRIGGYTGDTLGATQQLSEITIILVLLSTLY